MGKERGEGLGGLLEGGNRGTKAIIDNGKIAFNIKGIESRAHLASVWGL